MKLQQGLGILDSMAYRPCVIGFLRFVGLINAAAWFGATVFFTFGAAPVTASSGMLELLSARNFPYFSVSIEQLLATRFFHWYIGCSIVALLHVLAEWLYLGKYPRSGWLGLLLSLCVGGLVQVYGIQPRLKTAHRVEFTQPALREPAERSFRAWHVASTVLDVCLVCGLLVYVWRVAHPEDLTRFVSAPKFRS